MANVEVNTWAGLQDSNNQGNNVKWTGGDLDFNNINPNGYTGAVKLYGSIDFQGATFRNFRHIGGYLYPDGCLNFIFNSSGYVKNLNFVNAVINVNNNAYNGMIGFGRSDNYNGSVENCRFDVDVTASIALTLFRIARHTGYSGRTSFKKCAFNIKCQSTENVTLFGICRNSDCRIFLNNIKAKLFYEYADQSDSDYSGQNCEITGKVTNTNMSTDYMKLGSSYCSTNVYRLQADKATQIFSNQGKSVYDNTLLTNVNSANNATGCTPAQLKDAEYLNSIGFQIAT